MKKNAIRMVVFSLVAVLMLAGAGRLLVPKWTDPINPSTATVRGFYEEPKDSLDVLYLGTCNVYNNVNPLAMWRDYGFTGYVFATPDQEIWTSYYYLEEALKYQKPKVVVLDALMLPDVKHSEEGYARQALDNLRPSATKLKNAYATLEQPDLFSIASVMMPALRFHDRWKDLQRSDFEGVLKAEPSVYKGFAPIFYAAPYEGSLEHMTPLGGEGVNIKPKAGVYLERIQQLCEQNDIEFLLVKTPTCAYWNDAMYQCTLRFAEQLGIDYIDYNLAYEEMGIDWSQDFAGDARRMSVYGSEKFSRYLGAHLQQTYSLSDRREDSALAASWNDSAAYYERACALYELGKQDQFIAYLSELSQIDECVVVIAACDDASNALGQQDISAMRQLGLQEDLRGKFTWRYIAVLDDGRLLCERASPEDLQYEVRLSDDLVIEVTSGGQEAHILFNQQEASYQRRGMNIAVFDKRTGQIADQVSFDTYETRVGKHY